MQSLKEVMRGNPLIFIIGSILRGFVYGYNPNLLWMSFGVTLILSAVISDRFL